MTRIEEERIDESAPEMLQRLGSDGAAWAAEFRKTAVRLGYSDMDEEWLISWFANAIENAVVTHPDVKRLRLELKELRAQGGVRVTVKPLEWEAIDGGNAFRAPAIIFGWIRIETYTMHSWQVLWSVPGICNILLPSVFDTPDEAKAAAEADYRTRILSALETEAVEPVAWVTPDILAAMKRGERVVPGWKQSADFCISLYAHPPHSSIPTVTGWQPIETAPKDGSAFLGYARKGKWIGQCKYVGPSEKTDKVWFMWQDGWPQPTHWQPLPSPPALHEESK